MTDQLVRFFQYSWVLLAISGIFPLYLDKNSLKSKTKSIQLIIIFVFFAILGILVQLNFKSGIGFTPSEIKIILSLMTLFIGIYILPRVFEQCEVIFSQKLHLRPHLASELLLQSFEKIRAKIISQQSNFKFIAFAKGNYGVEYKISVSFPDEKKSLILMKSIPVGLSLTRFRVLFVVTAYPLIFALARDSFRVAIPIFNKDVDAEGFFFILFILLVLFLFLQNSIQHNFFYEFEDIQKQILLDLAKETSRKSLPKQQLKVPDIKSELQAAKERAEKIKADKAKTLLEEKRKKLKDRVDGIFGKSIDDEIEPDLVRKQLLIRKVKTILKSTPIAMEVTLDNIAKKLNYNNNREIEKIIMGLIERKEVQGSYNIWKGIYVDGDINTQFIEKTLSKLDLTVNDLEYIKLSRDGDVEIRFHGDSKKSMRINKGEKEQ